VKKRDGLFFYYSSIWSTIHTSRPQKSKPNVFQTITLKSVNKFPSNLEHSISD